MVGPSGLHSYTEGISLSWVDFKAGRNEFSGLQQLGPDPSVGPRGHRGLSIAPNSHLGSRWLLLPTVSPRFLSGPMCSKQNRVTICGQELACAFQLPLNIGHRLWVTSGLINHISCLQGARTSKASTSNQVPMWNFSGTPLLTPTLTCGYLPSGVLLSRSRWPGIS